MRAVWGKLISWEININGVCVPLRSYASLTLSVPLHEPSQTLLQSCVTVVVTVTIHYVFVSHFYFVQIVIKCDSWSKIKGEHTEREPVIINRTGLLSVILH